MTTTKKKISAKVRENRKEREKDKIPAVLYGAKRKSTPLLVDKKKFVKLYEEAGESTLVSLEIEGKKERPLVLIYDIQQNPIKGDIIHADFFEPNLKEEVEAEIPLIFVGESPAAKEKDGTLIKNIYEVLVRALPQNLPHELEVDVSALKDFQDIIYLKDLKIPSDVEFVGSEDTVVAMVSAPEDVEAELEKPIEEGEEPEVVGKEGEGEEEEQEEEGKEEKKEERKEEEEKSDEKEDKE